MSVPVLTFFNNKGGVGKTSLVYHLAWMVSLFHKNVVVVDLDPQANLTSAFLDDEDLEALWEQNTGATTIYRAIEPITKVGDLAQPILKSVGRRLQLVPGDVALAGFEEQLSEAWPAALGDTNLYRPFRILTAFWHVAQMAATNANADLIMVDVGPNLGAINRSALLASDYVVIPLGADLFSLQGLRNLGPTLRAWRSGWRKRVDNWDTPDFPLPSGHMQPLGYVVQQHGVRLSRPVKAYDRWLNRMPATYRSSILGEPAVDMTTKDDPYCLATIKHYRSLIPMAHEARKPIFSLNAADGAIGAHAAAVGSAYEDFGMLSQKIQRGMGLID
ncbi:MAG: AAA family ATPase [Planctomycetales bacterium]|nr:AAA family ATPase [Planctomycetales bacterium]